MSRYSPSRPIDVPPVTTEVHNGLYFAHRHGGDEYNRGSWWIEANPLASISKGEFHDANIDRVNEQVELTCACGHKEMLWEPADTAVDVDAWW